MASRDSDPLRTGEGEQPSQAALRKEVTQLLGAGRAPQPELAELLAGVQQQLARERGGVAWLRSRPTRFRIALAVASVGLLVAAAALGWPRPDRAIYPAPRMMLGLLVIAGLLAVQLGLALRPLVRPALPVWAASAAISTALLGLFGLYALPAAHLAHPASMQVPGWQALVERALPCLGVGLLLALASYGLVRALDRGGVRRTLLAAAYGGLVANLVLLLHCPVTAPAHLLLGHMGVAVLMLLAVGLAGAGGLENRRS